MIEIRHYISRTGKDVFDDWLTHLADARAQTKIATRIDRLAAGNFADCKSLGTEYTNCGWIGDRATECSRNDWQGVRVAAQRRDKRRQSQDIERALEYLRDYKERSGTS